MFARDTINVVVNPLPTLNLGPDTTICPGDIAILDATPVFIQYNWSTGSGNQMIFVNAAGNYSVTVTDTHHCQNTDSKQVFLFAAPVVNLGPDGGICVGQTRVLDAGPGFSNYLWSNGAASQTLTAQFPGTFSVTVGDANSCRASDTINLTAFNPPAIDLGNDTIICGGTTLDLDPGPGFTSYLWNNSTTAQTLSVITTGLYSVTVTDANGCTDFDDRLVIVQPQPLINLGADTTLCLGGELLLDAGNSLVNFTWNTGSSNQTILITGPGTYSVTGTDPFLCQATASITVSYSPVIIGGLFNADTSVCSGDSLLLDPGPGYLSYSWDNGNPNQYRFVSTSGTYSVTVSDDKGCLIIDDIIVTVRVPLEINIGNDTFICPGTSLVLDAGTGFNSYVWNTGATGTSITVTEPGYYRVVANYFECKVSGDIFLDKYCPTEIWVPNAFTPNADNLNDDFYVVHNQVTIFSIKIFEKWGKLVYESTDKDFRWNGDYLGKQLPEGVYSWFIEATQLEGVQVSKKGTVLILK